MSSDQQLKNGAQLAPLDAASPAPTLYDFRTDEVRPVTQADFDAVAEAAEADFLRRLLFKRLIGARRDKLRQVRKLLDDARLFSDQEA